jgi:FSR family fosmidomycin resistance protein-like MFS transporter
MARSGVFVSSGALGVAFGTLAGRSGVLPVYIPVGILLLCLAALYVVYADRMKTKDTKTIFSVVNHNINYATIILLASLSIIVRSYAGAILPTEWRTTTILFLFPAIGAFLGKASGGFLADKIGIKATAVLSLLSAAGLGAFGYSIQWVYLIAIILFNISMSITLCAIASVLPLHPGLAFGITAFALLVGNVPTFFIVAKPAPLIFMVLTIMSAMCLLYVLKGRSKGNEKIF